MKTISDEKYKEYLALKRWAKQEKVYQSVDSIQYLIDDIDIPIRKCVAMCALWELQPIFSCCGFNYRGQPYHKSHQYGEPYITFIKNPKTEYLLEHKEVWPKPWELKLHPSKTAIYMMHKVQGNPHWRRKDCIHFSEECNIIIANLERFLMAQAPNFLDEVILMDTNQNYKPRGIRHWQYTPKEPWHIKKELLDTY